LVLVCPSCRFENPLDYKYCGECGLNFSTGKKPSSLPWMAKAAPVRRREVRSRQALHRTKAESPKGEKLAQEDFVPPPTVPEEVSAPAAEVKVEIPEKKVEAEGPAESPRVESEEVVEPEDISETEEKPEREGGLSFWNRFDLGVIGFLAIFLAVICYAQAWDRLGKHFTGFQLLKNRAVSGGLKSDMKPLDVVLAVEGREVKSSAEIQEIVEEVPVGMVLNYRVLRKGKVINVPVQSRLFRPRGFFWTIGMNFAVGIGYLLIGMITFVKQHAEKNRWVFLVLCIAVFTMRVTTFDFYSTHLFTELFLFSWLFLGAVFFHFGMSYPEEKAFIRDRKWVVSIPYYVSILLFIILISVFYNPTEGVALFVSGLMGYNALAFVILLISLAHSALRSSSPINRMRAKVVLLGFCGSLIPIFSFLVSYLFRVNLGRFAVHSWGFSLLFPLTLGYAMVRHQLFGEGSEAPTAGTYKCSSCGNEIVLKRSQRIPICRACGAGGASFLWYRVMWKIVGV
jgi:hypothetical protein